MLPMHALAQGFSSSDCAHMRQMLRRNVLAEWLHAAIAVRLLFCCVLISEPYTCLTTIVAKLPLSHLCFLTIQSI